MTDSAEGPTPETNEAEFDAFDSSGACIGSVVESAKARNLERRLAEAQEIGMALQRNLGAAEKTNAMLAENWTQTERLLAAERARADARDVGLKSQIDISNDLRRQLEQVTKSLLDERGMAEQFRGEAFASTGARLAAEELAAAMERDAERYRMARTMPLVLDFGRIAPQRPDKFDALVDAALAARRPG